MERLARTWRRLLAAAFLHRCFYLFFALVLLVGIAPVLSVSDRGRIAANVINVLVLISAVAVVARSRLALIIALLLAVPTLGLQILGIADHDMRDLALSWVFGALFYSIALGYLLAYVFRRQVMDTDKLYGAAAAYMMLGVFWTSLFRIVWHLYPESYAVAASAPGEVVTNFLYLSFGLLTSSGTGDITPVQPLSKSLATLAQITGVLYVAILIARLAGIYPSRSQGPG